MRKPNANVARVAGRLAPVAAGVDWGGGGLFRAEEFFFFVEAVFYDGVAHVVFVEGDDVHLDGGDVALAVGGGAGGFDGLFLGEGDGGFGGLFGEEFEGFVDAHGLFAAEDAAAGFEVGVLAGDEDLAAEFFFEEGLDGAACDAVVAGEDAVERGVAGLCECGLGDFFAVLGLPVFGPVLEDDFELAAF